MITVRVPGDKSVTHRALILSALGSGTSRIVGGLVADDTRATAGALRALGAAIGALDAREWEIEGSGLGGLGRGRPLELDCANSGTSARLLLGLLGGLRGPVTVTGDASLRRRPMRRVTVPVGLMGARFEELGEPDRLPIRVDGGPLEPLDYQAPVASAQIKSALLLAGVTGHAWVLVSEPRRSRDHTERMLQAQGVGIIAHPGATGWRVEMREPPDSLSPLDVHVPGDFSSAAFLVVAALLRHVGSPPLRIAGVGLNDTRTGLLPVLERMGARIEIELDGRAGPEPTGDIVVHASRLMGTSVSGDEIPAMVDEVPALAIAAARAEGRTLIEGAGELRLKESDRLAALADNLGGLGVRIEQGGDSLEIEGSARPLAGRAQCLADHRIAMAFGVLGAAPGGDGVTVDTPDVVAVSYPGFWTDLALAAGGSTRAPGPGKGGGLAPSADRLEHGRGPVVTLDGPAGSGKSSTAKEVARRLGLRHLDSGALYRAATLAALRAGYTQDSWVHLSRHQARALGVDLIEDGLRFTVTIDGEPVPEADLRDVEVTRQVSSLSSVPTVRASLLDVQRRAASRDGLVADGRDMGTVVFPNADVKFFLVADLTHRARRRLLERGRAEPSPDEVRNEAAELDRRDSRDSGRKTAPLRQAPDAYVIDTSNLTFEEQVETVVQRVTSLTD